MPSPRKAKSKSGAVETTKTEAGSLNLNPPRGDSSNTISDAMEAEISAPVFRRTSSRTNANKMENDSDGTLNEDVFTNFEKSGKTEFLKFIKQKLKDQDCPVLGPNNVFKYGISSAIYDLLWHGLRCTLKKDTVLNTLSEIVGMHEEFPSLILDIINILDSETSLITDGIQEERLMFSQFLRDLDKVISEKLIKERLEIDTLQDVGLVKNKVFYTKFIKIKTKLYYKQRRFNLFREESEGYGKLITELNQDFEEDVTPDSVMNMVKSLIGCFNLDPNRVLDIIIESFETRPEASKLFIPLLRAYMPTGTIICELLGYKFRYFAETETPKTLFQVCALLLKFGVIELNDIYVWLSPTDRAIITDWEQELSDAKEFVRKLNVIVTNKDREADEEPPPYVAFKEETYKANQKFGLCEALLNIGDWENALKIIQKLPEQSVVVNKPIAFALSELIHTVIDLLYTKKCMKIPRKKKPKFSDDAKLLQKLQARDFSELRKYAIPMIIALGPAMYHDTVLMYKILRLMGRIIKELGVDSLNAPAPNTEAENLYYEVMTVMDSAILPSLCYLNCNCPMSEEIWSVLRYFPYHFRFSLYARWKNESYKLHPMMIRRRGEAQKQIKNIMKRVSKENVKPVGRHIGKLSHCAPGFLFDYILLQIQIYDNLIGPVVDSLKYLTSLSFDCLGYCLIEALAVADRDRFKHDGTSISLWLQSLASFSGAIYKKYNIELSGLLQFVANQLKSQKSLDLLILKEIVQKMAGVESAEEMTNEQLNAMCGGELLRGEAGYFSQVRNTKKSSQRLKDALANNDLAVAICLLMAQQKHCVIYRETAQHHLKLVGKLYDQCQDTLVQFGTFLGSTYSVDEYVERLPSIIAMLQDYHINTDVAFFLARPMFTHQINQKYDQLRRADPNAKKLTTSQKLQKYLEATNLIMNPIVESVRPLHGPKVWEDISPQFLVTFWSLSMYDLQVPVESYQKEISKLKQLSLQAADAKDSNASKNKKEQERYIALVDKLQDERKKQQEHVDKILQRLQQQKDSWFLSRSAKSAKNETITQFLQLCLFPRCTFTALDALYCAKFVHTIHNLKAANFSTLLCYDRIFCDISYSVTSCTENEATRYGRFLCALLDCVMRWHADQATFNRECANYPGFVTKFRVSNQFSEANDHVGYENYRHVCHKWHYKLTKAMVFCLDSKDYMQIRNALIILMRILPHFPVLLKLSQIIERKVEKVREEEKHKRPDLFVIASSYIGQLKLRSSQIVKESDFHQVAERPSKVENHLTITLNPNAQNSNAVPAPPLAQSNQTINTANVKSESVKIENIKAEPINLDDIVITSIKQNINVEVKSEPRDKEKSKIIKLTKEPKENNLNNSVQIIEIKEESTNAPASSSSLVNDRIEYERQRDRLHRDIKKEERLREREQRERERDTPTIVAISSDGISTRSSSTRSKREKRREERREERYRVEPSPSSVEIIESISTKRDTTSSHHQHEYETMSRNEIEREREQRARERDLSSVSNESNNSLHHRGSSELIEYEKESKRRKMESSSNSKKQLITTEPAESSKKDRSTKTKDRKEKLTDEEKDARRERKLGRKRERLEETSSTISTEHKRRRDVQNGVDDDIRERDKYHTREKASNERSHEKYERDRGGGNTREDRQYTSLKSTRSRMDY